MSTTSSPYLVRVSGEIVTPQEFSSCYVNKDWSVFVGSGLSARVYNDWESLVRELCKECLGECTLSEEPSPLELQIEAQKAHDMKPDAFCSVFWKRFPSSPEAAVAPAYLNLVSMNFASILTTNYDHGLCLANKMPQNRANYRNVFVYPHLKTTAVALGGIFYLHGKPAHPSFDSSQVVLTKRSFDQAYSDPRLTRFLQSMWTEVNLVIIGARLQEPELRFLLKHAEALCRSWQDAGDSPSPRRVIILPRSDKGGQTSADVYRRSLGLEVLTYETTWSSNGENHEQLHLFLDQVAQLNPKTHANTIPHWSMDNALS